MSRLLIKNHAGTITEIVLNPGSNILGRAEDNDHQISDPSVSGHHCELTVSNGTVRLRDLGSTNGTFIDSARVTEAELVDGQTVRLGSVEMVFRGAAPVAALPRTGAGPIRVTTSAPARVAVSPAGTTSAPAVLEPRARGVNDCAFHAGTVAAYVCQSCGQPLCPDCVKSIRAGTQAIYSCANCDGLCLAAGEHRKQMDRGRITFFNSIPGALVYPLKKNGPMMLVCGTVFFGLLDAAAGFLIGPLRWFLIVVSVGYLFSFMESIVASSGMGEEELPGWPEFSNYSDDIIKPFFRFTAVWVICLLPGILAILFGPPSAGLILLGLGVFCFPMTLLAVAMAGSISGLNPFIIFPAIAKVPIEYLVVCVLLGVIVGVQAVLNFGLELMPIPVVTTAAATFIGLYGTFVTMRILGILYWTKKHKLNWF